jgi:hypothetical protein
MRMADGLLLFMRKRRGAAYAYTTRIGMSVVYALAILRSTLDRRGSSAAWQAQLTALWRTGALGRAARPEPEADAPAAVENPL